MKRLLIVIALTALPVVPAQASWSPPVRIIDKADGQTWLGKLSDGSVIAAANYTYGGEPIEVAVKQPGGAFGGAIAITPPTSSGYDTEGHIATGPNGRAVFVSAPGLHSSMTGTKIALRDPDGTWRSVDAPADCCSGRAAIDADGNVTFAGSYYDGTNYVGTLTVDPTGAVVARRSIAPSGYDAYASAIIIAPDGTTLVEWYSGPLDGHVYLSSAPPGGDFGPPETIASGMHGEGGAPALGRAPDGTLVATFAGASRYVEGHSGVLYASIRRPGGTWQRPEQIPADPITEVDNAAFAINRAGDAVLAWHGGTDVDKRLVMSYRRAGGRWETATVGEPHTGSMPDAAIGGDGAAIVSDTCYTQCDPARFVSYDHLQGGGFAPPDDIAPYPTGTDATVGMQLAVDAAGDAVAVWGWADHGVFSTVHHVGAATAGDAPAVESFAIGTAAPGRSARRASSNRPRLFSYRLSRRARVAIAIERIAKDGSRIRVAKLRAALRRGANVTAIPPDVAVRLVPGRRYRATIVATGRSGRRSSARSVTFTR